MAKGKVGAPEGNNNGGKSRPFYNQLRKILAQEETTLAEKNRSLYKIGQQLIKQAAAGEEWAIKEFANRMDGKAIQGVELTGEGGVPLNMFDAGALRHMDPSKVAQLRDLLKEAAST